jgi:RNase adaptor protein for sRNA GlmZ degradation
MSRRPSLDELETALTDVMEALPPIRERIEHADRIACGCTCGAHRATALTTIAYDDFRTLEDALARAGFEIEILRLSNLDGLFDGDDDEAPV